MDAIATGWVPGNVVPELVVDAQYRLLAWYRCYARDLPWRRTRDPYRILVAETMLQQTQVDRVMPRYLAFLERFPDFQHLADAPTSDVIRAWVGLGYNRRALQLQQAARLVVEQFGGCIPADLADLMTLPGVGRYTAGAIACFAFERDVGFTDTNIRRVLQRVFYDAADADSPPSQRDVETIAHTLVLPGRGYDWNQALIELGATVCRARTAECQRCPLQDICCARATIQRVLAAAPPARSRPAPRFETTSRYFRGRIVDALRTAPPQGLSQRELEARIAGATDSGAEVSLQQHISGLVRDGLVVVLNRAVREDAAPYEGAASTDADVRYHLPD